MEPDYSESMRDGWKPLLDDFEQLGVEVVKDFR